MHRCWGSWSDRIGRKPVIVVSLIGTAVGSLLTGAANSLWLLFLGRIVDGASGGSLSVAQAAVADISTPEQRPKLVGMMGAAFGVGFVLGPAIGGLSALGGPHVPFYVAAALAAANAVAAIIRLPETKARGSAVDGAADAADAADAVDEMTIGPSGVPAPASAHDHITVDRRPPAPRAAPTGHGRLHHDVRLRRVRGHVQSVRQRAVRPDRGLDRRVVPGGRAWCW